MRNTPLHYNNKKGYDLIDVGIDYDLNFFRFNVLKYICRAGKKDNELQDMRKALDYIEREIKWLEQQQSEWIDKNK
jgi:CO dehydrogenase/acetyl-CoA synthase alpha subunit